MKKFFRMLLLAAVALMPVMGMAQDSINVSQEQWERQMRSQQYADSVKAAQQKAKFEHERLMLQAKSFNRQEIMLTLFNNEEMIVFVVLTAGVIIIVILCLRHLRKKAEDHKELINKLIEKDLLNSTETISKETIEALMNPKPKKDEKERYITDATILGIGIAASIICVTEHVSEAMSLISFILAGIGLLRIVTRATFSYFERKNAKDNAV